MELSLIEKATRIAVNVHKEQVRKSDNSPYIVHPFIVALELVKYNFSDFVVAAALCHDVLEDSDFSEHELVKELGNETIEIIKVVSEDKSLEWEERKEAYIHSIRISSENVKAVSISDKIHNAKSLLNAYSLQGKKTWDNFNRGRDKTLWFQNEMLKVFKETWKHPLVDEYEKLVGQMNNLD
ncbi:hypothetical protein A2442_00645 [Candidatus Campbellbacteria bacterium RIFOXYC2_FULL_35_25]|uniref:HD/PDEase domain-containing protein n=1 Tax=Candidatus Campbellbacteria bacterium RIFOXYC2_FULL_35_25 TaxID=1797582 RepID=A0A1F5EJ83_9BACT|nr:MAG: hypothetical protein A2442_00645 [Candidatus Campbellbacteria bacterium RIFOXYC2_FULL_35_25]